MRTSDDRVKDEQQKLGDEAPRLKDFILVIIIVALVIAAFWLAWFKLGWFH
jgi:hypothetical protein